MNYLELFAALTGIASIYLSRKVSVLTFPIGLLSLFCYIFIFYNEGWNGNMLINVYYVVMSIYGWLHWLRPNSYGDTLKVSFSTQKEIILSIIICIGSIALIFLLNKYLSDGEMSCLDAISAGFGIVGMWLTTQKKVENWVAYLIADIILIPMCLHNGLYFTSVQYLIYCYLAVTGFFSWRKEALQNG